MREPCFLSYQNISIFTIGLSSLQIPQVILYFLFFLLKKGTIVWPFANYITKKVTTNRSFSCFLIHYCCLFYLCLPWVSLGKTNSLVGELKNVRVNTANLNKTILKMTQTSRSRKMSSCLPVWFKLLNAENRNRSEEGLTRILAGLYLLDVINGCDSRHV